MVINILYEKIVLTLFVIVIALIALVVILIIIDFGKKRRVDRMVSPRYVISKSKRKGRLPMNEDELLKLKKNLLDKEKELKKMVISEKRDIDRQKKVSAKMLRDIKLESARQKSLSKSIRVGLASVEKQKSKMNRELRIEMIKLEKRRLLQSEQMCRNISKAWHEQVDAYPSEGREWLKELKKKKRAR